jgi:hypothetical protein
MRLLAGKRLDEVLTGKLPPPEGLTHPITGETRSKTEWAKHLGISRSTLSHRLSSGNPLQEVLAGPRRKMPKPPRKHSREVKAERLNRIKELREQGKTLREIGQVIGITGERVRQILYL